MKFFKFIHCNKCQMEYQIQWEDDDFQEPNKCASCGEDDIESVHSGVLM